MSKERARAREARLAARQAEVAAAAPRRERAARRRALRTRLTPSLPTVSRRALQAGAIVLAVEFLAWVLHPGLRTYLAVAVLTLAVLAVATTARRPTR